MGIIGNAAAIAAANDVLKMIEEEKGKHQESEIVKEALDNIAERVRKEILQVAELGYY